MQSVATKRQIIFVKSQERAKTQQILEQYSHRKLPSLKLYKLRDELRRKYTVLDGLKTNFEHYQLNRKSEAKDKKILTNIKMHMKVVKTEASQLKLLSDSFLSNMSENILPLSYHSQDYRLIIQKICQIFHGFLNVNKQQVFIAIGQISRNYYAFFQNCEQQPFSLCCNSIVYIRLQFKNAHIIFPTRLQYKRIKNLDFVNTQFYCSKCRKKIIQLFGQDNVKSVSPHKIKQSLRQENERKKVNMSVLIGSGKFKSLRIDNTIDQQSALSKKFNPESIFWKEKKKSKILKIQPKSYSFKQKYTDRSLLHQFLPQ